MTQSSDPFEIPKIYLAIDPGQANTGWAKWDKDGTIIGAGIIKGQDRFLDWLEALVFEAEILTAIVEQYRNRGGAVNNMSTMPTSQHIGAIARVLRKQRVPIVFQDPSPALSIGLRFLRVHAAYVGKHVPDNISATAHGEYWLRKNGVKSGD